MTQPTVPTALADEIASEVQRWDTAARIESIAALTPDASLRRYFRVHLEPRGGRPSSIVVMVFDSVASPEASGGGTAPSSDEAYVRLAAFFRAHDVRVPETLHDARERRLLLIEDLGDTLLADALLGVRPYPEERVDALLASAVEQIKRIQHIPAQADFFPFQRRFSAELFVREMEEFRDYGLASVELPSQALETINLFFRELASTLEEMPYALTHRDFHPWNLMVGTDGEAHVIDFQDALMAPRAYDIVALLNDRDSDKAMGQERYGKVLSTFIRELGLSELFVVEYCLVLLQRDLKVAGRFAKLEQVRGLSAYKKWIPGTRRRIGANLRTLRDFGMARGATEEFHEIIRRYVPEAAVEGGLLG